MLTKTKFKPIAVLACITLVVLALFCIGNTEVSAETYSGYCGGEGDGTNLQWSLDTESGVLEITGSGAMADYSWSNPWNSYSSYIKTAKIGDSVTSVGGFAFYNCYNLTSVTIPDSVTIIGGAAFRDCSSLTSVTIGDSVTSIGSYAFYNTGYYNNGDNWENGVLYIDKYLIKADTNISGSYAIKEGTKVIADSAFYDCSKLTSVTIPDSVTSIGDSAFYYCSSLTSVTIPDSVTSIGNYAFGACSSLTSITIPDSVTSIGNGAFSACSSLTSITIPDSVTNIGNDAFSYCSSLTSVVIPDSVTAIGRYAFNECRKLTNVIIGDGVTTIGERAFTGCSNLTSVTLGKNVVTIGEYAFGNDKLVEVINHSSLTLLAGKDMHGYVCYKALEIHTGESKIDVVGDYLFYTYDGTNYLLAYKGTDSDIVLPENYKGEDYEIYDYAFYYSDITSVTISGGVTTIGDRAFYCCKSLVTANIGNSVTWIGNGAFYYCSNLESVRLPENLTIINHHVFDSCTNLKSIVIPDKVESIYSYAFRGCTSLTEVVIGAGVISIWDEAFKNCPLTSVTFKETNDWRVKLNGVTTELSPEDLSDPATAAKLLRETYLYHDWEHTHIHKYTDTVVAPTCTEQGYTLHVCRCEYSYKDNYVNATGHTYNSDAVCAVCDALYPYDRSGSCGNGVTWEFVGKGELVISGKGAMSNVSYYDLPYSAYKQFITKVTIESGITYVGPNAFYGFDGITEVTLPDTLVSIGGYAFYNTYGLTEITVPSGVVSIGYYAFANGGLTTAEFAKPDGWYIGNANIPVSLHDASTAATYLTYGYSSVSWMRDASGDGANDEIAGGYFHWSLSSKGVLTIYGNGAMPDYGFDTMPWVDYKSVITEVRIGEGITSVGRCAFYGCSALRSVSLPSTITEIKEYGFYGCGNLTEITIPASVTAIGKYAFRRAGLVSVDFGVNYGWSAGESAFTATEVYGLGAGYLTKNYYKFDWVRDVNAEAEEVDPNFVTGGACNTTVKWELVYIDEAKTQMKLTVSGNGAMPDYGTGSAPWYAYLDQIVEIEVEAGVTAIGRCAFYGLKNVTSVTLHEGLVSIGDYAFNTCRSLAVLIIPDSVTAIGKDAFGKTQVVI